MSMTKQQRRMAKLGNAMRAYRGARFANGKWFIPPQKMAQERVTRWLFRCKLKGDITRTFAEKVSEGLAKFWDTLTSKPEVTQGATL